MVYVDLLIFTDLLMNYIVLIATSIILNRFTKFKRIFLSSVTGTIPLILLFIDISNYIIFVLTIIFSIIMSVISFKYKDLIYTMKNIVYMYLISIFIGGSIYLLNTQFLYNINEHILKIIILIIFSPIITYIYIKCLNKIKITPSNYYKVDIYLKDKPKITMIGYLDTGNKLIDPYTYKPIIIISKKRLKCNHEKKILVPYNTVDNSGLMVCFKPEKIYVEKVGYIDKILIGLVDNINIEGAECLLNTKLFERRSYD